MRRGASTLLVVLAAACAGERAPLHAQARDAATAQVDAGERLASTDAPTPRARPSDEAAIVIAATKLLVASGRIRDPEANALDGAFAEAYAKMRAREDDHGLDFTHASDPDLFLYAPAGLRPSHAVVFLHGYGGRFALPCWQMAEAAAAAGWMTACPNGGADGEWWTPAGEGIVRRTFEHLAGRGVTTFVLAGLSNGAIGAARIAPRLKDKLRAVVLIAGGDASRAAGTKPLPVLVMHGKRDQMFSEREARAHAIAAGGRYVDVDAGHFAMLTRAPAFDRELGAFIRGLTP